MKNSSFPAFKACSAVLLVTVLGGLSAPQAEAGGWTDILGSGPKAQEARSERAAAVQRVSVEGQTMVFDLLIQAGGNGLLTLENGQPLTLESLKKKIPKIQYIPERTLFTANGKSSVDCQNSLEAQWLTAKDNKTGRPIVSLTKSNNMEMDFADWMLLTHESISSLGIVDDEYQVTSPLFTLQAISAETKTPMHELMKDPAYSEIGATLKNVRIRDHAPRYKLGDGDICYKWNDGVGSLINGLSGGTTGIGGGGDGSALNFKVYLMRNAGKGWDKAHLKNQGAKEKAAFLRILGSLGVEPLPETDSKFGHFMSTLPIQMEFKKSKRTRLLSVYFLIDRVDEIGDRSGWSRAAMMIYTHIAKYMVPAKTKELRDRHTVYGGELAHDRKITKEIDLGDNLGPYFLKD